MIIDVLLLPPDDDIRNHNLAFLCQMNSLPLDHMARQRAIFLDTLYVCLFYKKML